MAALNHVVAKRGGHVVSGEYRDPHCEFVFECGEVINGRRSMIL